MQNKLVAKVAVSKLAYYLDELYTYQIPDDLKEKIKPGVRVVVPFGRSNSKRFGVVLQVSNEDLEENLHLKPINKVLDLEPILDKQQIDLVTWLKQSCFCTYFEAFSAILPAGINYNLNKKYSLNCDINKINLKTLSKNEIKIINLLEEKNKLDHKTLEKKLAINNLNQVLNDLIKKNIIKQEEICKQNIKDASEQIIELKDKTEAFKLTEKQKNVYEFLSKVKTATLKEVIYYTGESKAVINALAKKQVIEIFNSLYYRTPYENINSLKKEEIKLSPNQQKVFEELKEVYENKKPAVSLLYGVTGSGKTKVYTKLIDKALKEDKDVILMVPEISLTSHMIRPFKERYASKVAVYHSALSMGERMDEWKRCKNGKAKIILGTRSAIFAPFKNLGLIIIDEEQEHTYKSESAPRFNAKNVAKFRVKQNNAMLLLSSATPSVESFYKAKNKIYSLHILKERYGGATLPKVKIIDMNQDINCAKFSLLSSELIEAIDENIKANKQSVLLLNRRGYNTFIKCRNCGEVVKCPNCSIPLRFHLANNRAMCHCCGYSIKAPTVCPICKNENLIYKGEGTQHIEEDIKKLIPSAKVLRIDADSTAGKQAFDEKFEKFNKKEYNILVGTQMVAKGLNFPDITLVGVINADQALFGDDFRNSERAFSLITQVIGRAGRSKTKGKALIQTYSPENNIIKLALNQDYNLFYETEIQFRKMLIYPPFSDICMIGFVGKVQDTTKKAALDFFKTLTIISKQKYKNVPLKVFVPLPGNIEKINNKFRYKIIMKCKNNAEFRNLIKTILIRFGKSKEYKNIKAFVDINPYSLL